MSTFSLNPDFSVLLGKCDSVHHSSACRLNIWYALTAGSFWCVQFVALGTSLGALLDAHSVTAFCEDTGL